MQFKNKKEIVKEVQEELNNRFDDVAIDGLDGPQTWGLIIQELDIKSKYYRDDSDDDDDDEEDDLPSDYLQVFHKESPNHGETIVPKFIVLHHSSGSHDSTRSWILQSKSRVSYHYLIDEDGSRTQFVKDTNKAWHAGPSYWKGYHSLNNHSIAVGFWGDTNKRTPNYLEIDSCAKLCIRLMTKFGIKIDGIITHADIAPNRKNDCSDETHKLVLKRVKKLLTDKNL